MIPRANREGDSSIGCLSCGLTMAPEELGDEGTCLSCGAEVSERHSASLQKTLAWLITALALYIPANALPIMVTRQLERSTDSTIIGGIIQLWHHGSYLVAGIIFVASVLVPLAKILSLSWLCWIASRGFRASSPQHMKLYRFTELLGRWSMIDVCVVAVLVSVVRFGNLLNITAGPAGIAFAGMVISTMIAAHHFDSRLIWDAIEKKERETSNAE